MADGGAGERETVELEAMRKSDSSWHPCVVSLSPCGGLVVEFEGQDSRYIIINKEEASAQLRVRSVSIQGDDCCHIGQGEHVLAASEPNSKSLFFDAVVEKVVRVRHSKRANCRCTFMVKWLHQETKSGISTVPSGSIMKLATESISKHPVLVTFLTSYKTSSWFRASSSSTVVDENDGEMDLLDVLQKQVEEIGSFMSKKESLEDIMLQVKHDMNSTGEMAQTVLFTSCPVTKSYTEANCKANHLRRSSRKQSKALNKIDDPVPSFSSSLEDSVENRSALSPLAARAALASLVTKLPQKLGFSLYNEGKCGSISVNTTDENSAIKFVNGTGTSEGFDSLRHGDTKVGLTSNTTSVLPFGPEVIVQALISPKKVASGKKPHIEMTPRASISKRQNEHDSIFVSTKDKSVAVKSLNSSEAGWGFDSHCHADPRNELASSTSSVLSSGPEVIVQALASPGRGASVKKPRMERSPGALILEGHNKNDPCIITDSGRTLSSSIIHKQSNQPVRAAESAGSAMQKQTETSNTEAKTMSLVQDAMSKAVNSSSRVTRSAARKGKGNLTDEVKPILQDNAFAADQDSYASTPDSGPSRKRSCATDGKQDAGGESMNINEDNQCHKKPKSSNKQASRFSSRLRQQSLTN